MPRKAELNIKKLHVQNQIELSHEEDHLWNAHSPALSATKDNEKDTITQIENDFAVPNSAIEVRM